ncbi:MAG: tRNA uridine-5-carboxymethylaminomethyl(34) synthesis enzyme MnmG, partial [Planktomarina sp.]
AAHAAGRMGLSTALVTLDPAKIGVMSCNPAVGGLGKGHLVREIDALDGILGVAADAAGIQFRLLNRSKGPAVQGPRVQADREQFQDAIQNLLKNVPQIKILSGEVVKLLSCQGRVSGVELADGSEIRSTSVILTTGTFLRGLIHIGDVNYSAGRMGEKAAVSLSQQMESLGAKFGRLKTGTPPRLNTKTINWQGLEVQDGDEDPSMMSFLSAKPILRQVSCGITHTNQRTHEIIQKNLSKSAMYGGQIDGLGPRYCPSIEDKIVRFADKESHQIFLEPEGLNSNAVYPNGISTSLPQEVQVEYVQSIAGLERAEILQPGYAIEYDFLNPVGLSNQLESPLLRNLFLAGQINGTTGYEEAAAQGLIAALGAAQSILDREVFQFDRTNSYMGVMVDDLVTRGVTEPYRMFTSRAEFRLKLRVDNADQRLTELGRQFGCVGSARYASFCGKLDRVAKCHDALSSLSISPNQARSVGVNLGLDGRRRTGQELLAIPGVEFSHLVRLNADLAEFDGEAQRQVEREALYVNYIQRQDADHAALSADFGVQIPEGFDYSAVSGLSNEMRQKLSLAKPASLGHAKNIEGVTPAALTAVLLSLRRLAS